MTVSKVTLGTTGGLSIAAGAGYGSYKLLIPSIGDGLEGDHFKTLGYGDTENTKWKILTKFYKNEASSSSRNKDIFNPSLGEDETANIKNFKDSCRTLLEGTFNLREYFDQATFWCTDFGNVRHFLSNKQGIGLLSGEDILGNWKDILKSKKSETGLEQFLGGLTIIPTSNTYANVLKSRCSRALNTTPDDQDSFETSMDNVLKYCRIGGS